MAAVRIEIGCPPTMSTHNAAHAALIPNHSKVLSNSACVSPFARRKAITPIIKAGKTNGIALRIAPGGGVESISLRCSFGAGSPLRTSSTPDR